MQRINALWIEKDRSECVVDTFDKLLNKNFIGFIPDDRGSTKFMLITQGTACGLAVHPTGTWDNKDEQRAAKGQYYVFDSAKELLQWMLE